MQMGPGRGSGREQEAHSEQWMGVEMKTEAEARKCWCPWASIYEQVGSGSYQTVQELDTCIGSKCMMWEWGEPPNGRWLVTHGGKEPEEWAWNPTGHIGYDDAVVEKIVSQRTGDCGRKRRTP